MSATINNPKIDGIRKSQEINSRLQRTTTTAAARVRVTDIATAKVLAPTATASPATTAAAAATTRVLHHLVQPRRNFLVVLVQQLTQFAEDVGILFVDKGERRTRVTGTARTTNAVDVIL